MANETGDDAVVIAVPAKYLCPICCDILHKPVKLPCCQTHCCLPCLQQGLEVSSSYCFFCRKRLMSFRRLHTGDSIVDTALQAEIEAKYPDRCVGDGERSKYVSCLPSEEAVARVAPDPGELQLEAQQLMQEFHAERAKEAQLSEATARKLAAKVSLTERRHRMQLEADALVAERLSREIFDELRQRYLVHHNPLPPPAKAKPKAAPAGKSVIDMLRRPATVKSTCDEVVVLDTSQEAAAGTIAIDCEGDKGHDNNAATSSDAGDDGDDVVVLAPPCTPAQRPALTAAACQDSVSAPALQRKKKRLMDDWIIKQKRQKHCGETVDLADDEK